MLFRLIQLYKADTDDVDEAGKIWDHKAGLNSHKFVWTYGNRLSSSKLIVRLCKRHDKNEWKNQDNLWQYLNDIDHLCSIN